MDDFLTRICENIPLHKRSKQDLREMKIEIENELERRLTKKITKSTKRSKSLLFNTWFPPVKKTIEKRKKNSKDDIKMVVECLKDEYEKIPSAKKWVLVDVSPLKLGDLPPCDSEECWWSGNTDRLCEYDNTIYQSIVDPSISYCDICLHNNDKEDESNPYEFDEFVSDFEDWLKTC